MKYAAIHKSSCFCISLCRAANALTAYYDERLESLGITVKQYSLLSSLAKLGAANTGELAEYVNLERSTLTRNIAILEAKGWLRDQAPAGKRAHQYVLTREGAQVAEDAESIWRAVQSQIQSLLGEDEVPRFLKNLNKFQQLQLADNSSS